MHGQTVSFSDADLQATATAYNTAKSAAPLCIGHPNDDKPAYGRVDSLVAKGGALYAVAEFADYLMNAVKAGTWKYVSAKFAAAPNSGAGMPRLWTLQHVGFLGGFPPAVKGLGAVEFGESRQLAPCLNGEALAFAETQFDTVAFAAPAGYSVDVDRLAVHVKALSVQRAIPGLSYIDAIHHAMA